MRFIILGAGAGGMYCGSCLRDNILAKSLLSVGHKPLLVPLYSPMTVDGQSLSGEQIFFGGVNAYLQYASAFFRLTPRLLDWIWDRKWVLNAVASRGASSHPSKLVNFTLATLAGQEGPIFKEFDRLGEHIQSLNADVVVIPNAMLIAIAGVVKERTKSKVVCQLTGEDLFIDAMPPAGKQRVIDAIKQWTSQVDRFIATSDYYADKMADYLKIDRERISVVPTAIDNDFVVEKRETREKPSTVGYFARICPEKGAEIILREFTQLLKLPHMHSARLRIGGTLTPSHEKWWNAHWVSPSTPRSQIDFVGQTDYEGKKAFFDSVDVLCVPTIYPEAKGIYALEALARGVPVLAPNHGALPQWADLTGGIELYEASKFSDIPGKLYDLLAHPDKLREMAHKGRQAVKEKFSLEKMGNLFVAESAI